MIKVLLCAFTVLYAFNISGNDEFLTIKTVKIEIDDNFYIWNNADLLPEAIGQSNETISPLTIISFTNFHPGMKISRSEIKKEIFRTGLRLNNSHFFYSADIIEIPDKENKNISSILITVTDGYRNRFGGGDAYAFFGIDNIKGKRKYLRIYAGYNYAGVKYSDHLFLDKDFLLSIEAYYLKSDRQLKNLVRYNSADASFAAGYRISPDLSVSLKHRAKFMDISYQNSGEGISENKNHSVTQFFSFNIENNLSWKIGNGIFHFGIEITPELIKPDSKTVGEKYSAKSKLKYDLESISFNSQISGGLLKGQSAFSDEFNMYCTPDLSIRSGYEPRELIGRKFGMINNEIRFNAVSGMIGSLIDTNLSLFLFNDAGVVSKKNQSSDNKIYDAYGMGCRILFNAPVFAYFSFSYGFNRKKNGRFIFSGTAGF
ncbi:MAG: hypothetical protein KA015_01865 [Spirochaetes bacterium]|nr:hypothetical protein [Spirochaetota bacterium]